MKLPFGLEITRQKKVLHPDFKTLIEFAFEIKGVDYYSFKNSGDMPPKRHEKMNQFIKEVEMRINSKDILGYLKEMKDSANKGDLVLVAQIIGGLENIVGQYIETDTYYRMFSSAYFPIDPPEDLTDYDYDYNDVKIEAFKSMPAGDFFFLKHLSPYLPQTKISKQDFLSFSKLTKRNKMFLEGLISSVLKKAAGTGNGSGGA